MRTSLVLGLTVLLLVSCTVRVPQLDAAQQLGAQVRSQVDPEDYAWLMTFNDVEARLYAIQVGRGIVFANEEGLEVAFDGWDVVVVSGLPGALGMIRVDKTDSPRVHHVQGLDAAFEVSCEEPSQTGKGWHIRCRHERDGRSFPMDRRISVAGDGQINRIEAHLIPGVGPMVLEAQFEVGE